MYYLNQNGHFEQVDIFKDIGMVGRGMSVVDIDNDGDKDIVSNNNNQTPKLFTNNLNPDNWYGLVLKCNNRIDVGSKGGFALKWR